MIQRKPLILGKKKWQAIKLANNRGDIQYVQHLHVSLQVQLI